MSPDLELTVKQAGQRLGLADRTIRRWCRTGKLKGRKVDRERGLQEWRIDAASVEAVRQSAQRGQRPSERRGQAVADELRLLREQLAEYETVMGQMVSRIENQSDQIAQLQGVVQRLLPPARTEKRWWQLWRRD